MSSRCVLKVTLFGALVMASSIVTCNTGASLGTLNSMMPNLMDAG